MASLQNNDSARAVQYLYLNHEDPASEAPAHRPVLNVPIDLGYSLQRFVNPQGHAQDRTLRSLHHFTAVAPLTEDQSRARMAEILAVAIKAIAPARD
ncbi:hypothetical protein GGR57DRAFT_505322 [Xylariaceae sp. FL1272]|nr:hypothetical protein GGR57DRAFT_505322 [Xylariaceae sp. FL1272]